MLAHPEGKEGGSEQVCEPREGQLESPPPGSSGVVGAESACHPPLLVAGRGLQGGGRGGAPCLNSPGSWGEGGTLRVSSRLPRAPGGRGCREGGKHPPLPAPSPSFFVMHFLRPRIPFVLKFKKIRPPRAASGAGGEEQRRGFLSGRRGAADQKGQAFGGWSPAQLDSSPAYSAAPALPPSFRPEPAVRKPSSRGRCPPRGAPRQLRVALLALSWAK